MTNRMHINYFIEGERICTKTGGGFGLATIDPTTTPVAFLNGDADETAADLWVMVQCGVECSQYPVDYVNMKNELKPAQNLEDEAETNQFFYHPDHLGSSSFITDATGYAVQHLQYLPFGETFVDQQNGYDSRYTFSAKEKDDETQYSYFGARYYDSDLSVWLSVDPMSDERSWISPYNYCQWNPVGRVDPSGALDIVDSWRVDLETGEVTWLNTIGGSATQYFSTYYKGKFQERIITNTSAFNIAINDKNQCEMSCVIGSTSNSGKFQYSAGPHNISSFLDANVKHFYREFKRMKQVSDNLNPSMYCKIPSCSSSGNDNSSTSADMEDFLTVLEMLCPDSKCLQYLNKMLGAKNIVEQIESGDAANFAMSLAEFTCEKVAYPLALLRLGNAFYNMEYTKEKINTVLYYDYYMYKDSDPRRAEKILNSIRE